MTEIVLVAINDDGTFGEEHRFTQSTIKIGKRDSSHLKLDHPTVTRMHAVIDIEDSDTVSLVDLGSVQGTHVNDQKINKCIIKAGDHLQFGEVHLVVESINTVEDDENVKGEKRDLGSLKERIAAMKGIREQRAQAVRPGANAQPKKESMTALIGMAVLEQLFGDDTPLDDKLDTVGALVNGLCEGSTHLRDVLPADRIAEELDGLIEDVLMPTWKVAKKRLEELSNFVQASMSHSAEFRAGLVKKLKTEFGLSEEHAMEIMREQSNEMRETMQKITGQHKG